MRVRLQKYKLPVRILGINRFAGRFKIAISTAGQSGALAQRLRKQLEEQFGPEWESWLRWLGEARSSLHDDPLSPKRHRIMLHRMASKKKQVEFFDLCPEFREN